MEKRWRNRIALGIFMVFLALLLLPLIARLREPRYHGKRISQWIDEFDPANGGEQSDEAADALRHVGPDALPWILPLFSAKDSPAKLKVQEWIGRHDTVPIYFEDAAAKRRRAARVITILGPQARTALPALEELLKNPDIAPDAAAALSGVGAEAVPVLLSGLTNQNPFVRNAIVWGFELMGTNAELALPAIVAETEDKDPSTQCIALNLLRVAARNRPDLAISVLTEKFHSGDAMLRRSATLALGAFATNEPAKVLPTLLEGLDDLDGPVRVYSAGALAPLKQQAMAAVPKLTELLKNRRSVGAAAAALTNILGAKAVGPIAEAMAEQTNIWARIDLSRDIAPFGSAGEPAIPTLIEMTGSTNDDVRHAGIDALQKIHARPDLVVPRLIECLSSTNPATQVIAADALGSFGADAKTAVRALQKLAQQQGVYAPVFEQALKRIDPEGAAKAEVK